MPVGARHRPLLRAAQPRQAVGRARPQDRARGVRGSRALVAIGRRRRCTTPRRRARRRSGSTGRTLHAAHPALVVGVVTSFGPTRAARGRARPTTSSPRDARACSPRTRRTATAVPGARGRDPDGRPHGRPPARDRACWRRSCARARRGRGSCVEVSLLGAALAVQIQDLVWLGGRGGRGPRRRDARDDLAARADEIAGGLAMNPYYRCLRGGRRLPRGRLPQPGAAAGVPRAVRARRRDDRGAGRRAGRPGGARGEAAGDGGRSRRRSRPSRSRRGSRASGRPASRRARARRASRCTPTRRCGRTGCSQDVEQPGLGPVTMLGGVFRSTAPSRRRDAARSAARRRHRRPCWRRSAREVRGRARARAVRRVGPRRPRRVGGAARARLRARGRTTATTRSPVGSRRSAGGSSGATRSCSARRSPAGSSSVAPSRRSASSTRRRSGRRSRSAAASATARAASRAASASRRSTAPARCAASRLPPSDDPARLHVWGAVTLAYLAGLADGALEQAVEHARKPGAVRRAARGAAGRAGAPRRRGARAGRPRCSPPGRRPIPRRRLPARTRSRGREAPAAR